METRSFYTYLSNSHSHVQFLFKQLITTYIPVITEQTNTFHTKRIREGYGFIPGLKYGEEKEEKAQVQSILFLVHRFPILL